MMERNAVILILELHKADGVLPLSHLPGLWHRKLDERWEIYVNGHAQKMRIEGPGEGEVLPFDCYVEYNGWPAGMFSIPTGEGCIAAGSAANYETFCDALEGAIKAAAAK
jgi:hypothetical protein